MLESSDDPDLQCLSLEPDLRLGDLDLDLERLW
jgi:hypothetical protein